MPAFDPRGANEAGYAWEPEYARINPAYFDQADVRMAALVQAGLVPCIVGSWGYYLPLMGQRKIRQHWRYMSAQALCFVIGALLATLAVTLITFHQPPGRY
jgi:hypothetical protein